MAAGAHMEGVFSCFEPWESLINHCLTRRRVLLGCS
jgi:hypothetical protein